jgi:hypothetical protein
MSLLKEDNKVIQSTDSGRMYIDTVDFFKQAKVQQMVKEMVKSDLYKNIVKQKSAAR